MECGASCPNVSDFFPVLACADLQGLRRRLARLLARMHLLFDTEVDRRLRGRKAGEPRKEHDDFLDVLLDVAARDGAKADLDRDTLRALFTDLFLVGSDSSSSVVEWAMTELLRNPSSMVKAHEELAQVIGSTRSIKESDIDQLPYLQALVKETFCLHPPGPFMLPQQAQATVRVTGYMVPQGARVMVNLWAIGRDESILAEPDKFMPERFLGKTMDFRGVDFELIPFGAGRRICPG
ncbi:hypothetical protein ACQ4PT_049187 [Festuca glaucescens]